MTASTISRIEFDGSRKNLCVLFLITQLSVNWNVILSVLENSKQRKDHQLNLYGKRRKTVRVAVEFCENLVN